jgi:hypothetical protein
MTYAVMLLLSHFTVHISCFVSMIFGNHLASVAYKNYFLSYCTMRTTAIFID